MSRNHFHSDWHFNHDFVARTRGFETSAEHDEAVIDAINSTVTKRDHLWVLGDVFMGSVSKGLEKIARVEGVKHLVLGNHDAAHPMHRKSHSQVRRFLEVFESVHLHEQVFVAGQKVLLSHFPFEGDHKDTDRHLEWRLRDTGMPLVHGHVHKEWRTRGRQFNAGVDHHLKPVTDGEVEAWLKGLEA